MGDDSGVDPDEQTRLAAAENDPNSMAAWSLADDPYEYRRPLLSARGVTIAAVGAGLLAVVVASVLVGYQLRGNSTTDTSATPQPSPPPSMIKATVPTAPTTIIQAGPPVAAPTATVTVRAPVPLPPAPRRSITGTYTTILAWSGSQCLDVRIPSGAGIPVESTCSGGSDTLTHTATSGQMVGADPIMGSATAIACRVIADASGTILVADSGTAGDGHDINCIVDAP